jgi:hypothetical protein
MALVLFGFIMLHLSTEGGLPVAYPHLSFADKVGFVQLFNLLTDWSRDEAKLLLDNSARYSGSDEVA